MYMSHEKVTPIAPPTGCGIRPVPTGTILFDFAFGMDIIRSKTNSNHLLHPHGEAQLLVRHFPRWLSEEEKESLLSHFGATDVVLLPPRGKMVCACVYHQGMCILWTTFVVKTDIMLLVLRDQ